MTLRGLILKRGSSKRKETRPSTSTVMTKDIPIPKESGIIRCSWLEVARTLLKEIEQIPAIFLLNPLGPTLFTYDDLSLFYQRTIPTELCLLIPHKQAETRLSAALRSPRQGAMLTGLLRSDRWKTLPTGEEERKQALDGLINMFTTSIQQHFSLPVQHITLSAQTRPATIEIIPYTLIFATRRQDSLIHMNDAVCMYRRRLNEQSYRGILGEEWFVAQQQERLKFELRQASQRILQQGQAQRIRRWPDLRQQILIANFGQFTQQEYDTIMQQLIMSREVRCEWRSRSAGTDEKRLPGNDDTLVWR